MPRSLQKHRRTPSRPVRDRDLDDLAVELGLPRGESARLVDLTPKVAFLKRGFDLVGASIFLVLGGPVMVLIAIAIRLTSPGPVLFHQLRVGQSTGWAAGDPDLPRTFTISKFRTMHATCSGYEITPRDHSDVRITRVGRFLRKTSLDELPQLFSVLRGHMSLVGPRPEMPFVVRTYDRAHRERLEVRPGLTGLWQLYGSRSLPIHHEMKFDSFYLRRWSPALEAIVLWRTFLFVLRGGNV